MPNRFAEKIRATAGKIPGARNPAVHVAASILFALLIAEAIVRIFSLDWHIFPDILYYQKVDYWNHRLDPDPDIAYTLRPGQWDYGPKDTDRHVHISPQGARGPDRADKKPAGVFRIICLGGSNTYGSGVQDGETWPARLEAALNAREPGRFEVWNMGASAYVAVQMAALGKRAIERYQPDLVIFAPSNSGAMAFLWAESAKPYFRRDPSLWRGFFPPECLTQPSFIPYGLRLALAEHSALFRYFAAFELPKRKCQWINDSQESRNLVAARRFFQWARSRVKTCVFVYPGADPSSFRPYYRDAQVPALELRADDKPSEYRAEHPNPEVFDWYARQIAPWLVENKLVP